MCDLFPEPRIETRTRLVLFIHHTEERKPTNTGRLVSECLSNVEVHVRGRPGQPTRPFQAAPGTRPVLLFPHERAASLDAFVGLDAPVTLIVPDGSWRQASKVRQRVAGLADVPCAFVPEETPSRYRLRSQAHPTALSTLEAIARALGALEGSNVRSTLERVFFAMVERTLLTRGQSDCESLSADDQRVRATGTTILVGPPRGGSNRSEATREAMQRATAGEMDPVTDVLVQTTSPSLAQASTRAAAPSETRATGPRMRSQRT